MLTTSLVLQDSDTGRVSGIVSQLAVLSGSARFRRLRVSVAYASYSGCKDLVHYFEKNCRGWHSLRKRWLVSIDFGRSEVSALNYLRALPNSEVRVPNATEVLAHNLVPRRCFHPKTYVFDSGIDVLDAACGIFVGSGNLTLSGLHTGVEHGTSLLWIPPLSPGQRGLLKRCQSELSWWDEAWEIASPATDALLADYREKRPTLPLEDRTPSVRKFASTAKREVETKPGLAWANAKCFWIKTNELYKNLGRGRPGNQLDLRRGTRVYFGFPPDTVARNTNLGEVVLQYDALPARACSVRFGDNSMDKLNLPIPGTDGPEGYDHSVVHFERIEARRFRVRLGNEEDLAKWKRKSQKQGMLDKLAGGREFGFYS
jgi:hypothetical protein